jgi:hypothetical protein
MMKRTKLIAVLGISFATLMGAAEKPAGAITAELAKKCRAMAIKAHPYKMPGEGAGSAVAERDYFSACIARGGNMPDASAGGGQSGGGQAAAPPPAKQ